jgi:DNA repair protein RecO
VPLFDDDALVLDNRPYRDRHLVVTLLTRRGGLVRGVFRGARGGKVPKASAAQILSEVHMTAFQGPHAELATIRQLDLRRSSFPITSDIDRATAAAVVAELLVTFCPLGDPAPRRYRLGVALLDSLLSDGDPATIIAYGQYWSLKLGGVLPSPEEVPLDASGTAYLAACRSKPLPEIAEVPPPGVAAWLDQQVRLAAERPLHALDFFRSGGW